jgi:hypothetical protein
MHGINSQHRTVEQNSQDRLGTMLIYSRSWLVDAAFYVFSFRRNGPACLPDVLACQVICRTLVDKWSRKAPLPSPGFCLSDGHKLES